MKQIRILLVVLNVLLFLSAHALAEAPVNTDERFTFLGKANDLYYYGWQHFNDGQSIHKELWVKIIPGDTARELLQEKGDTATVNRIDSILCRVAVGNDVKTMQVTKQIYYDSSGTVISKCSGDNLNRFIADECAAFLTAYFSYK